ncbi:MAG TPA: hypothetical protein VF214_02520 [Edaphobacter sp.]
MARFTIIIGILLILLGIIGFVATGSAHPTALIPCAFGLLLVLFGWFAQTEDPKKRMLWMHIAVTVGLFGFLFTTPGLIDVFRMARGIAVRRPAAAIEQSFMWILCGIFVAFCVRSFINARRSRTA